MKTNPTTDGSFVQACLSIFHMPAQRRRKTAATSVRDVAGEEQILCQIVSEIVPEDGLVVSQIAVASSWAQRVSLAVPLADESIESA